MYCTVLYSTLSVYPTTQISTTSGRIALKFGRHNLGLLLINDNFFHLDSIPRWKVIVSRISEFSVFKVKC